MACSISFDNLQVVSNQDTAHDYKLLDLTRVSIGGRHTVGVSVPDFNKNKLMLSDDFHYKSLRKMESNADIGQQQLVEQMGISLGRVNYSMQALIAKCLINAKNYSKCQKKSVIFTY